VRQGRRTLQRGGGGGGRRLAGRGGGRVHRAINAAVPALGCVAMAVVVPAPVA